nr:MAG TPA: hypothetical protein [Caudoviricetes sp.]
MISNGLVIQEMLIKLDTIMLIEIRVLKKLNFL